jgi:molybdate transport system regulatory protein
MRVGQTARRRRPASLDQFEARSKIWCERDGELVLSEWRLDLLAAVGETGSLSRAAERLDVPYRTAWHKLRAVEEQLGVRLLETQSGGTGGGGSFLTPQAHELIRRFRRVRKGVSALVTRRFESEFADWLG